MLKSKLAGVVVAALLTGAGAVNAAESTFPTSAIDGERAVPAQSTYADRHLGAPEKARAGSTFPASAIDGERALQPLSTRADQFRGRNLESLQAGTAGTSAFPVQSAMD